MSLHTHHSVTRLTGTFLQLLKTLCAIHSRTTRPTSKCTAIRRSFVWRAPRFQRVLNPTCTVNGAVTSSTCLLSLKQSSLAKLSLAMYSSLRLQTMTRGARVPRLLTSLRLSRVFTRMHKLPKSSQWRLSTRLVLWWATMIRISSPKCMEA